MESIKGKDMRQPDLSESPRTEMRWAIPQRARAGLTSIATAVIPYQEPAAKGDTPEFQSTLASTLPMAAVFMRNKYIGW